MAIIIFFVLLMLSYIINKYYEKKYEKQMLFVKNKFGDISILLNKIINKDNKDNNKK